MIKTRLPNIEELSHNEWVTATDAAFILGASQAANPHGNQYQTRLASASVDQHGDIKTLSGYGHVGIAGADDIQCYGIRPVMKKMPPILSAANKEQFLEIDGQKIVLTLNQTGRLSFEYGAYPTEAVTQDVNRRLEEEHKKGALIPTRHFYTTVAPGRHGDTAGFVPDKNPEYEFEGERYVRLRVQNREKFFMSTGEMISQYATYWVKVKPIRWICDTWRNLVYTEQAILSGLPWNDKDGNKRYDKSLIARYLRDVFDFEMMQSHDFFYARQMDTVAASRLAVLMMQNKLRAEHPLQFNEQSHKKAWERGDEIETLTGIKNAQRLIVRAQQRVEQEQARCREYLANARA